MFKSIPIAATIFLIFPSVSFAAYGAKNEFEIICVPLNTQNQSDKMQAGPFPINLAEGKELMKLK